MWDLKLNNTCNHRIINEKLDIKYSDPNYYAILKRPVYGDNLQVKIVHEDDLFPISKIINSSLKFAYNGQDYILYSENDIIIDSVSSTSPAYERYFYGITKYRREYFIDDNGNKKYFYSLEVDYSDGRVEGESYCIKADNRDNEVRSSFTLFVIMKALDNNVLIFDSIQLVLGI